MDENVFNLISGNLIGTTKNQLPLGNFGSGVLVNGYSATFIGGLGNPESESPNNSFNIIAFNSSTEADVEPTIPEAGIRITGPILESLLGDRFVNVFVSRNLIGVTPTGFSEELEPSMNAAEHQKFDVIIDDDSHGNIIGTTGEETSFTVATAPGYSLFGNVIGSNSEAGILAMNINFDLSSQIIPNFIAGNWIGVSPTNNNISNGAEGIKIVDSMDTFILNNQIRNNQSDGIAITDDSENENQTIVNSIRMNTISDNLGDGISIINGSLTLVGGTEDDGNLINNNEGDGILIAGSGSLHNRISGNTVTENQRGIHITDGAFNTVVGFGLMFDDITQEQVPDPAEPDVFSRIVLQSSEFDPLLLTDASLNLKSQGGDGNVILGNSLEGVLIDSFSLTSLPEDPTYSEIQTLYTTLGGNYIGIDRENVISANYVGVAIEGQAKWTVVGNNSGFIDVGATSVVYGDLSNAAYRNIISGNTTDGILVRGIGDGNNPRYSDFLNSAIDSLAESGTKFVVIDGNFIGIDDTGQTAAGNGSNGVRVTDGASFVIIGAGGANFAESLDPLDDGSARPAFDPNGMMRNVISANGENGILVEGPEIEVLTGDETNWVDQTFIGCNFIGVSADATGDLGNGDNGIEVSGFAWGVAPGTDNLLGPIQVGNIIAGNGGNGIYIHGGPTSIDLSDHTVRILWDLEHDTTPTSGDLAGLKTSLESNPAFVTSFLYMNIGIAGNLIGVSATIDQESDFRLVVIPNDGDGVKIDSVVGVTIGGVIPEAANIISGNVGNGISLQNLEGQGSTEVRLNYIGTGLTGGEAIDENTTSYGNGGDGISVLDSSGVVIGRNYSAIELAQSLFIQPDFYYVRGVVDGNVILIPTLQTIRTWQEFAINQGSLGSVISNNLGAGIRIAGGGNNFVSHNVIGTNWFLGEMGFGTAPEETDFTVQLGNRLGGVLVLNSIDNQIGTFDPTTHGVGPLVVSSDVDLSDWLLSLSSSMTPTDLSRWIAAYHQIFVGDINSTTPIKIRTVVDPTLISIDSGGLFDNELIHMMRFDGGNVIEFNGVSAGTSDERYGILILDSDYSAIYNNYIHQNVLDEVFAESSSGLYLQIGSTNLDFQNDIGDDTGIGVHSSGTVNDVDSDNMFDGSLTVTWDH